jgi:predicted RNA-binding Zn-ribbon protein involved in translation (DUF1610 family)
MTSETRTTIQLSDLKAIEFECTNCHHRLVRPLGAWKSYWDSCPECGNNWIHYKATMDFLGAFASQAAKISAIDTQGDKAPFVVRFEIAQPKPKEQP